MSPYSVQDQITHVVFYCKVDSCFPVDFRFFIQVSVRSCVFVYWDIDNDRLKASHTRSISDAFIRCENPRALWVIFTPHALIHSLLNVRSGSITNELLSLSICSKIRSAPIYSISSMYSLLCLIFLLHHFSFPVSRFSLYLRIFISQRIWQ